MSMRQILDTYANTGGINFSRLKHIVTDPARVVAESDQKETAYLTKGSMVDVHIQYPDEFNSFFYIAANKKPTEKVGLIADVLTEAENYNPSGADILAAADLIGWYPNWKPETRVDKLRPILTPYLTDFIAAEGRTIVTDEEAMNAMNLGNTLADFAAAPHKGRSFEVIHSFIVHGMVQSGANMVEVKGLVDRLEIDHEYKTIRVSDYKTSSFNVFDIYGTLRKFKYLHQVSLYTFCLQANLTALLPEYSEYQVITPSLYFINVDTGTCMQWIVSEFDYQCAVDGGHSRGVWVPGIADLLDLYVKHRKYNRWDYPMEYIETGSMSTNVFGE